MHYDAFISYRHSKLDMFVAKKLHKALETFKVPRAVAGKCGKKNIKRVFRDQEELPIGSDLSDNITAALTESEFLLVICSPETPKSYWVGKEIDTFIKLHGRKRVLAILIEGEPAESFPPQILTDDNGNPVEPLAADLRGTSRKEILRKMKTELMRLAAPILHCSYDDLKQRHRERQMKKMIMAASAVALLGVAFSAYSAYNNAIISENYKAKQINQSKYLANTALDLLEEGDRQTAALVALEALPTEGNDRPYVPAAQYALSATLHTYDTGNVIRMDRSLKHDLPVRSFTFNQSGSRVLSLDQGQNIYVWNLENGDLLTKLAPQISENGYVIAPVEIALYEEHIIICEATGIKSVDLDGELQWCTDFDKSVIYCNIDTDADKAVCISGEILTLVDISTGEIITEVTNQRESSFSSAFCFNEDKSKFAVSHIDSYMEQGENGLVSVYDLQTGSLTDYTAQGPYIAEVIFSADGDLVVASEEYPGDLNGTDGKVSQGYVEKISLENGGVLWTQEYENQLYLLDAGNVSLRARKYEDAATGITYDHVFLSENQTVYTWDAATGEQVARVDVTSGIKTFLLGYKSCFGYLAESNGTVNIVNMNTGMNYTAVGISTGKNITDVNIRNGVLVVSAYASPSLTVMKYQEGAGMKTLESYEESVNEVHVSAEETYYAVELPLDLQYEKFCFYRTEDDAPVGEWIRDEGGYHVVSGFMDDTHFVYIDDDGGITFYDVESGRAERIQAYGPAFSLGCDINEEYTKAFLFGIQLEGDITYQIYDLQEREIILSGTEDLDIIAGVMAEDGTKAYCNTSDNGIYVIDVESGDVTPLALDDYRMLKGFENQNAMAISKDGSLLAVSCVDGVLRVLDTKKIETVAEIPFASAYRRFIGFSADSKEIMLQGDDYYFRVYNLEQQQFTYISAEQYYEIRQIHVDEPTNTISILTLTDMIILERESYECVAQADFGMAYLPESGAVFCRYSSNLYRFPYMSLEMLLEEAGKQFEGKKLTQQERVQYNVD